MKALLRKSLGVAMLLTPFVAVTLLVATQSGWVAALSVWLATLAIVALIIAGFHLIDKKP